MFVILKIPEKAEIIAVSESPEGSWQISLSLPEFAENRLDQPVLTAESMEGEILSQAKLMVDKADGAFWCLHLNQKEGKENG